MKATHTELFCQVDSDSNLRVRLVRWHEVSDYAADTHYVLLTEQWNTERSAWNDPYRVERAEVLFHEPGEISMDAVLIRKAIAVFDEAHNQQAAGLMSGAETNGSDAQDNRPEPVGVAA